MGDERTIYVVCKLRVQSTKYKVGGIDCIKMHILYDTSICLVNIKMFGPIKTMKIQENHDVSAKLIF